MDIAKYIGLFLLKNEYCYLPGIGSLQIQKKPAVYNKETSEIEAPLYEILFQKGGGSIDDSFANFIANNERISIAHASNNLRDFCAETKVKLLEGNDVPIPGIGKFTGGADIGFESDKNLHIQGKSIPFFKNSPAVTHRKEEAISNIIEKTTILEPKSDEEIVIKPPQVNWGKIILLTLVILSVLAVLSYFLFYNKEEGSHSLISQEETMNNEPVENDFEPEIMAESDSVETGKSIEPVTGVVSYKVILNDYNSLEKANTRASRLKSYGNENVEVVQADSSNFYVVLGISSDISDTVRVQDSLRRLFNPQGKMQIIR